VNSSLTFSPIARGWVNLRWWASAGLLAQMRHGWEATNLRWALSRSRRGSPNVSLLLSILAGAASACWSIETEGLSSIGEATGRAAERSFAVLAFLGRPLGRLTASVDAKGGLGSSLVASSTLQRSPGLVGVDAGSSVTEASGEASCRAILAAKASSTCFASSADRRFLTFRMAIARVCLPAGFGSPG